MYIAYIAFAVLFLAMAVLNVSERTRLAELSPAISEGRVRLDRDDCSSSAAGRRVHRDRLANLAFDGGLLRKMGLDPDTATVGQALGASVPSSLREDPRTGAAARKVQLDAFLQRTLAPRR